MPFKGNKIVKCSTKLEKGGVAKATTVTFNLDGVTDEHVLELAIGAAIVLVQNRWRNSEAIPATVTYKLAEIGNGKRAQLTPEETEAIVMARAQMDPAYKERLMKQLGLTR